MQRLLYFVGPIIWIPRARGILFR